MNNMKRKIYNLLLSGKDVLFALVLTVFCNAATSQTTYTFNYTGGQQTISLPAGTYTLQAWGADGGDNLGNGSSTYFQNGGKGGYSVGTYTLANTTTVYVNVGGRGGNSISTLNSTVAGGYNGGGYGSENTASGKSSGAGGGGATHIATATGVLSGLSGNQTSVLIVGGGGGGAGESNYASTSTQYNSNGGYGGGSSGLQNVTSGYQGRQGQGGTQTAGGGGGDNASATAGVPLQGIFGAGGYNNTANGNTSAGGSGAGGGGGGWYGGGAGWVGATAFQAGSGGGGSGYIGGVTNGTTVISGQAGFVTNPDIAGNGMVLITELCSVKLIASGSSSTNPVLCSGQSLTITTNAISNYSWSTGATTNSIVVAPTTNTVYSLTAMSPSNCMTTANMNVIVSAGVPVLTLAATPASVCIGDSVKLNATGALSYTWSNGVNNNQLFPPAQTSTYVVTGKNGCGTTTAAITVTALPLPVTISSTTNTTCSGSPVTLTVTGGATYTWSTNQTASVIVVAPTSQTTYTVLGKKGGCVNTKSITIATNPLPNVQLAGTSTMVCSGSSVTLTATGGNNYTWSPSGFSGGTVTDTPTASVNYQVSGSNSFGCVSGANHVVIVNPLPTITVSSPQPVICPGASITLMATGGHTYQWNTGAQTKSLVVNPSTTTSYTVVGTFTNTTCKAEAYFTVNVDQPTLSLSPSQTVCPGTAVTMSASGSAHNWSNGGTSVFNSVTVTTPTMYTVSSKVLTANNLLCVGTGTINLGMHVPPVVVATATRSSICKNEKTILTASGADTYLWTNNNYTGATLTFSATQVMTHTYTVIGTDVHGCMDTAQVTVKANACTGLAESSLSQIAVYPNPSNGNFTIKSEDNVVMQVLNEMGQLIRVVELSDQNQHQAQISGLPKGIYFIQGIPSSTNNGNLKQKVIVE